MSNDGFWMQIDQQLDQIEQTKPTTAAGVVDLLGGADERGRGFFAGSGGDRSLLSALIEAGWRVAAAAYYHYLAQHPETGECLEYIEGDVIPCALPATTN